MSVYVFSSAVITMNGLGLMSECKE